MKALVSWASGALLPSTLLRQPAGTRVVCHDGPPQPGVGNWLRAHVDGLRYAPATWAADPCWEAIGFDEWKLGAEGHSPYEWAWRAAHCREECLALGAPRPPLVLAWNLDTGLDEAVIVEALQLVSAEVDAFWLEAFLDFRDLVPLLDQAHYLIDCSVRAGVWAKTILGFNLSDAQHYLDYGADYAVFGHSGSCYDEVVAGYLDIWHYAARRRDPLTGAGALGMGLWSTDYLTALSRQAYTDLARPVHWYPYWP